MDSQKRELNKLFAEHTSADAHEFKLAREERQKVRHLIRDQSHTLELMRTSMPLEIREAVAATVNGKITRLDEKIQAHIDRVEPYLTRADGYFETVDTVTGLGKETVSLGAKLGTFVQWLSALAVGLLTIKSFFPHS